MGSKGSNTTTTSQQQTYNPAGASYIQNALNQAGNAAQQPFNIPQAPVAGFSQDQMSAFNNINNAQGMAQPYINQANNYFQQSAQRPDVASFYNPMAANVTAQLQNIFGQQNSQNTGQLTQAAGGVGADRIAVGQANLANQQGLAAGQTYAGLWQQAQQAAAQQQGALQSAGYGTAALGSQAQNAALSGAQAQLATGGLQQQLQQAQLNSPYQQQLARAAFPYQQAQFLAGITGSLAPGLGGTTQGTGSQTAPAPSIWSQILGGGTAAAGLAGQFGAFNGKGSAPSWGGGSATSGDAYGGSGANPLPGLSASDYGVGYAEGGAAGDKPIDIEPQSIIPQVQSPSIQAHVPQLNLTPQQPQGGGGGGSGVGDIAKIAQMAMMFMARGGAAKGPYNFHEHRFPQGYADGGASFDERWNGEFDKRDAPPQPQGNSGGSLFYGMARKVDHLRKERSYADGGDTDVINPDEPFRMPDHDAVEAWRRGTDADRAAGLTAQQSEPAPAALPSVITQGTEPPATSAMAFAPQGAAPAPSDAGNPFPAQRATIPNEPGLIGSPWAALTAAGLGIMGGTSPFAGVNIGQGAQQGLKMLEQQRAASQKDTTIQQAADRLDQEARFHEDQYNRIPMYQQKQLDHQEKQDKLAQDRFNRPYNELTAIEKENVERQARQDKLAQDRFERPYTQMTASERAADDRARAAADQDEWVPAGTIEEDGKNHPAVMEKSTGVIMDAVTGKPPGEGANVLPKGVKKSISDEDARDVAERYIDTGNRMVLSGLGYSGDTRNKVNQQIKKVQDEKGVSNQELATREAEWEGRKAGQRVLAQQEAKMGSAALEAEGAVKLARGVIERVPRTGFLPLNKLIEGYQKNTLNPDQVELMGRLRAISNTYAAVMNRGASVVTDTARHHADDLLNSAGNAQSMNRALDTMLSEIDMAKHSPDRMRRFYRQQYGANAVGAESAGASSQPTAAPAKAVSPQDQQAIDWANANPSDPRAAAIKQRLGVQ